MTQARTIPRAVLTTRSEAAVAAESRDTIPFYAPNLTATEIDAATEVLRSGWITMGPRVEAFERRFAERLGARHAVAVNSCTAALHLANLLLDVGPGDEVVVPSLTFAATANAAHYTGARVVFADVESLDDWCISPRDVARRIGPRTKAVVAMHYAGFPCDMAVLREICSVHNVTLYEDAAHGLGGRLENRALGTIGRIGCFSFFSNKALTTAEGGMLVTDDDDLAARARRLRSHGQSATAIDRTRGAFGYEIDEVGYNYRLDDVRAAIGLAQLERFDFMQAARRKLMDRYRERLTGMPEIRLPMHGGRGLPSFYLMPILLESKGRTRVRQALYDRGIQTSVHYPPVHLLSQYKRGRTHLPVTEQIAEKCLSLPLYPTMTLNQVDRVCDALEFALGDSRG